RRRRGRDRPRRRRSAKRQNGHRWRLHCQPAHRLSADLRPGEPRHARLRDLVRPRQRRLAVRPGLGRPRARPRRRGRSSWPGGWWGLGGGGVGGRAATDARRAADRGNDREAIRHLRRWSWGMRVVLLLLVVAAWDMVLKPGV